MRSGPGSGAKRRRLLVIAAVWLSTIAVPQLSVAGQSDLSAEWEIHADANQRHPKLHRLILPITEDVRVYGCSLNYFVHRQSASSWTVPALQNGGKVKVNFEIVKGADRLRVGKRTAKAVIPECCDYAKQMSMMWTDPSGLEEEEETAVTTALLPVDLEAGDQLVWKVKFKAARKLEFSDIGDGYWDRVKLSAGCSSCGTVDSPCE